MIKGGDPSLPPHTHNAHTVPHPTPCLKVHPEHGGGGVGGRGARRQRRGGAGGAAQGGRTSAWLGDQGAVWAHSGRGVGAGARVGTGEGVRICRESTQRFFFRFWSRSPRPPRAPRPLPAPPSHRPRPVRGERDTHPPLTTRGATRTTANRRSPPLPSRANGRPRRPPPPLHPVRAAFFTRDGLLPRPSSVQHWQLRDLVACPRPGGGVFVVRHCSVVRYGLKDGKVRERESEGGGRRGEGERERT